MTVAYSYEEDVKTDARLAGLEPGQTRTFRPSSENMPKPGDSRYLIAHYDLPSGGKVIWENDPDGYSWGYGRGLPDMDEMPRFRDSARKAQITQPEIFPRGKIYLITKRMLDLIVEFDSQAVQARPSDYLFSDGLPPDEAYYLADFVRTIEAVDYARSVTYYVRPSPEIEALQLPVRGRARLSVQKPLALRSDIAENIHIFRCEYGQGIFFSRAIVEEMVKRRFRRLRFDDPAEGFGTQSIYVNGNGKGTFR